MAVPFQRSAGLEASHVLPRAPGNARSTAGYSEHQGFIDVPNAADMLGSQANETVLVEQPEAYITQKARVKRNRRTEWDYYVQFPAFPEDEGVWYSARAIKTSHPHGAELIREFEHPNDSPDLSPQPTAQQRQPAPAHITGLQTQEPGPSQIGSQSLYEAGAHSSYQQPHTQDHFASQLQQPADHMHATAPLPHPITHGNQQLQAVFAEPAFNSASQNDGAPPLHWSFDRMQQAASARPQQLLPVAQASRLPSAQLLQSAPVHNLQYPQAQASIPQSQAYSALPGQLIRHDQGTVAHPYPPGRGAGIHREWSTSQQPQWQPRHLPQGQADLMKNGPQYPSHPAFPSSALLYQQPLRQPASYLPFRQQQQQQQLADQHVPLTSTHAQHPVPAQQPLPPAHGQPGAQQLPQPGFTPAAGFQLPLQAPQQGLGPESGLRGFPTAWAAQPPGQAASEDAVVSHATGQRAVQAQKGPADSKLHGASPSDILQQQASLWRQAASKRSALADLVPAADKGVGPQSTSRDVSVSAGGSARGMSLLQPSAMQEGCAAFKPAVQACIAVAGLPLAKPFYQQAVEHAMEQHTQHRDVSAGQEPSHPVGVKQVRFKVEAPDHSMQDVAAAPVDNGSPTHGGQQQNAVDPEVAQQQQAHKLASPTPSSDSDLGTDLPDQEAKTQARRHISAECWDTALISVRPIDKFGPLTSFQAGLDCLGARRVGEGLELHVKWGDGYDVWMSLEALKRRQHCKSAIIDFLVSKVRKKTKG